MSGEADWVHSLPPHGLIGGPHVKMLQMLQMAAGAAASAGADVSVHGP